MHPSSSFAAAIALGILTLGAGCGSPSRAAPASPAGSAARLVIVSETVDESSLSAEFPAMTYRPARIFDASGALVTRLDPHREPPATELPPGRYKVVSRVNGDERFVLVDLAPGERKVISVQDLAEGSSFDG